MRSLGRRFSLFEQRGVRVRGGGGGGDKAPEAGEKTTADCFLASRDGNAVKSVLFQIIAFTSETPFPLLQFITFNPVMNNSSFLNPLKQQVKS